jgi:transcriptional regulator with XRE-family HTH domain
MDNIGNKIKMLRAQQFMTQEELAKKVGYSSRTTINKVETGIIDLSQTKIMDFAKALNTTPVFLMGLENQKILVDKINADKPATQNKYIIKASTPPINAKYELAYIYSCKSQIRHKSS